MLPSCTDCREERLYPNDIHDAREIVGEHVQGHLGRDFGQTLHQKVGCSHPHLERSEPLVSPFSKARLTASIGMVEISAGFPLLRSSASVMPTRPSGGSV